MCEMCLVNNDDLNKSSHTSMNPPVSMVSMGTQPRSQGTLSPLGAKVPWQVVVTLFDFISQILSNKAGLDQWLPKILATMWPRSARVFSQITLGPRLMGTLIGV